MRTLSVLVIIALSSVSGELAEHHHHRHKGHHHHHHRHHTVQHESVNRTVAAAKGSAGGSSTEANSVETTKAQHHGSLTKDVVSGAVAHLSGATRVAAVPTATATAATMNHNVAVVAHEHKAQRAPEVQQQGIPGVSQAAAQASRTSADVSDHEVMDKIKALEQELSTRNGQHVQKRKGQLDVNGPLPIDFAERFAEGVSKATGCSPAEVRLLGAVPMPHGQGSAEEIVFESRSDIVDDVENQASKPDSRLAQGLLHSFLVVLGDDEDDGDDDGKVGPPPPAAATVSPAAAAPEVDLNMPFGDLEPFGREDTAHELTQSSIHESDAMVDQLERAEVAEEKRAVFRALTRLRGAAITSFDGIARSQTGNIDDYARQNQWRKEHPVRHLAQEESDVSRWAFPEGSDQ